MNNSGAGRMEAYHEGRGRFTSNKALLIRERRLIIILQYLKIVISHGLKTEDSISCAPTAFCCRAAAAAAWLFLHDIRKNKKQK